MHIHDLSFLQSHKFILFHLQMTLLCLSMKVLQGYNTWTVTNLITLKTILWKQNFKIYNLTLASKLIKMLYNLKICKEDAQSSNYLLMEIEIKEINKWRRMDFSLESSIFPQLSPSSCLKQFMPQFNNGFHRHGENCSQNFMGGKWK